MVAGCKGLCHNEKDATGIKYNLGFKRCSVCYKKIKTEDIHCYCCGYTLRMKGRMTKEKNKTEVKRI